MVDLAAQALTPVALVPSAQSLSSGENMIYARVIDGTIVEVIDLPEEFNVEEIYVPEVAAEFVAAISEVDVGWTYMEGVFSAPPAPLIDDLKAARIATLTADCAAAIVGGYLSSALGSRHTYPSGVTDQINMMGSVTASLLPELTQGWATPFWCEDDAGIWAFRMHSAEQIQQAGSDGKMHVVTCQAKLEGLTAQVTTATSEETVTSINW
ncbi:hypothetical protein [Rhizobium metallidurans]|uniref:DUF4376 domain-containing protein n=1 Tax=Rhizobium metallidurans TaxID=1265931 RepID=UPI001622E496|nr:hypothetical protein [Rhizobium metallidurans]